MAQSFVSRLVDLTIANGATASNAISGFKDARAIGIFAPAALLSSLTYVVQVEPTPTGTPFRTLQSGGADISIAASKGIIITDNAFNRIRVLASAAVTAAKTFQSTKRWEG